MILLLPLLMLAFTWFMSNRQNSKQKEFEAALKPGDVVVTQSGLIGKIVDLGEVNVKLEIAPGVNVKVRKSSIQGPEADARPAEATATKDKANEKKA
jgi:preprotein translocase subunit YajC